MIVPQYFVITCKGKESEKKIGIYVCVTESLCRTPELTHYKSTTLQLKERH